MLEPYVFRCVDRRYLVAALDANSASEAIGVSVMAFREHGGVTKDEFERSIAMREPGVVFVGDPSSGHPYKTAYTKASAPGLKSA